MKTSAYGFLLVAIAVLPLAPSVALASGSSGTGKVVNVVASRDNSGWVKVKLAANSGSPQNPDGCAGFDDTYYLKPADANYDAMLKLITAAWLAGRDVSFWVSGCETANQTQYPHIYTVNAQ